MKFFHIADLHFGKSLNGVSMIDGGDQPAWVEGFLRLAEEERPDAVVIAGDIYDRSSPSGDAVALMDHMLTALSEMDIPVLMAAGNHDSGQRLAFAGDILAKQNVYIAGKLEKKLQKVTLQDEFGPVHFWLLPYVFPALVSGVYEDDTVTDYQKAMERILADQEMDFSQRNVLVAHQNITQGGTEGIRGGSETMVGGVGQIDWSVFDGIDYVALGHIHAAYPVGRETVRYAGSPLCYHFDEIRQQKKGPVLVTIGRRENGQTEIRIEVKEIAPLHPLRELRGTWEEVSGTLENEYRTGEYVRVVITDRKISPQISDYLRTLLGKRDSILMELQSDYRDREIASFRNDFQSAQEKPVEELFGEFYRQRKAEAEPDQARMELLRFAGRLLQERDGGAPKDAVSDAAVQKLLRFAADQEA